MIKIKRKGKQCGRISGKNGKNSKTKKKDLVKKVITKMDTKAIKVRKRRLCERTFL